MPKEQIMIQADLLWPAWQFTKTLRPSSRHLCKKRSAEGHEVAMMSKKSLSSKSASLNPKP